MLHLSFVAAIHLLSHAFFNPCSLILVEIPERNSLVQFVVEAGRDRKGQLTFSALLQLQFATRRVGKRHLHHTIRQEDHLLAIGSHTRQVATRHSVVKVFCIGVKVENTCRNSARIGTALFVDQRIGRNRDSHSTNFQRRSLRGLEAGHNRHAVLVFHRLKHRIQSVAIGCTDYRKIALFFKFHNTTAVDTPLLFNCIKSVFGGDDSVGTRHHQHTV